MGTAPAEESFAEDEIRRLPLALSVAQAARLLRIGRSKAYEAIKTGTWPTRTIRVGRCIRIPAADVLRLLGLPTSNESDSQQHKEPPSTRCSNVSPPTARNWRRPFRSRSAATPRWR